MRDISDLREDLIIKLDEYKENYRCKLVEYLDKCGFHNKEVINKYTGEVGVFHIIPKRHIDVVCPYDLRFYIKYNTSNRKYYTIYILSNSKDEDIINELQSHYFLAKEVNNDEIKVNETGAKKD